MFAPENRKAEQLLNSLEPDSETEQAHLHKVEHLTADIEISGPSLPLVATFPTYTN